MQVTLESLVQLRWVANRIRVPEWSTVSTDQAGTYQATWVERGMEFQELRHYQPGDDIRYLDSRATARTGKPHTKLYQTEKERPQVLVVDLAPTLFFGSQIAFKSVIASRLAALLGWQALQRGDRVGAFILHQATLSAFPLSAQTSAYLLFLKKLAEARRLEAYDNHWAMVSKRLLSSTKPGTRITFISDFYAYPDGSLPAFERLTQTRHCQFFLIQDPLEQRPPIPNDYPIQYGQKKAWLSLKSRQARAQYQDYCDRHRDRVKQLANRHRQSCLILTAQDDLVQQVSRSVA